MKASSGFALFETVIYIALLSIITSIAFVSVYQIIDNSAKTNAKITVEREANFIIGKINWAFNTAISPLVILPDELIVERLDSPSTVVFDIDPSSGNLRLNGDELNTSNVRLTDLDFAAAPTPGEGVKMSFALNGRRFETVRYIR